MKATSIHTTLLFAVALILLPAKFTPSHAQTGPDAPTSPSSYSCVEIPQSMTFCGETIDLTRFDRRERMDRELLAFSYMHSTTLQMIKRANRYFPIVESILHENGVPDDFKYLMSIESNNNPLARSGAGAAGLWQFMPATGREFGLEVGNSVDERYHVEKATRAACRYLKQAYARFGSWTSVAASYNAGQGRISRELKRQYEENPIPYREIKVESTIEDLPRFAKSQGITYALLRNMNPWLRSHTLHVHGSKVYYLRIPDKEGMYYNPRVLFPHDPKWTVE